MIRHFIVASLLIPALAAAATDVVVWHSYRGRERAALEKVAANYNARQKDIQIDLLPIPYDAFPDKVTAAIPRGKGPDLFIFAQDRVGDWAASGLIESIDFWADDALRKTYLEPTIEALTYDAQLYGLPMAFKEVALIRNTKLVPKAPQTTDEMVAAAKKVTDAKANTFGLVYENANFYFHAAWFQGFGARVFDKKGTPTLASPESVASLAFAADLAHGAGIMPQEVTNTLVTALFNQGHAGMVISGPWFLGEIQDGVPFEVSVLPIISKNGKRAMPFLTAEGVIMSAKCQNKKQAFEAMRYLTSVEAGTVMATEGRQTTARREVYELPEVKKDRALNAFKEQLQYSVPMPNTPAMRAVWTPATTAMNKAVNGKIEPKAALDEAQAEVEKALKGARR